MSPREDAFTYASAHHPWCHALSFFVGQPSAQPTFDSLLNKNYMHTLSRSFRAFSSRLFSTMHRTPAAMVQRTTAQDVEIHQPRDPSTLSNYSAWRTKHITANLEIDFTK